MAKGEGLLECEAAFERLVAGKPNIREHVGLSPDKITAGVVSVEAGFDRGYLKKSRDSHKSLIARIEAHKKDNGSSAGTHREVLRRARRKAEVAELSRSDMKEKLDAVLTQNLMLVNRVRELEQQLKAFQNVLQFKV